jgi:hypothetical protein
LREVRYRLKRPEPRFIRFECSLLSSGRSEQATVMAVAANAGAGRSSSRHCP